LRKSPCIPKGPVDGHAPLLSGKDLNAYRLAGIGSDHECTELAEAREKLGLGFTLMIRQGSLARNLADLLPAVTPATLPRTLLVSDDCHPQDLLTRGHLNHLLRLGVSLGLDPLDAITMVTLNPAGYFGLRDRGAIAPGLAADLVALGDLRGFRVDKVWKNGRLVAEEGRLLPEVELPDYPVPLCSFAGGFHQPRRLVARSPRIWSRSSAWSPGSCSPKNWSCRPRSITGDLGVDLERDLLKLAVVERHHASGRLGLGLVQGFGLKKGALASTVAHDSHNLALLGASEADMLAAARHLIELGGGLAVVADGEGAGGSAPAGGRPVEPGPFGRSGPAPMAGSGRPTGRWGVPLDAPFMTLSFLSLEVIPALKLTDLGLVDVNRFQVVSLFGRD
jgi:adenine deaminase